MRADRRHGHGKHGHFGAAGSITQKSPTLNPTSPLPVVFKLDAYAAMLAWSQRPGAGERLQQYLNGHHHADPLDLTLAV